MDFFKFLNRNLDSNSNKCYGDFFENKSQDDKLKNVLNDKEYSEYEEHITSLKNRLSGNQTNQNQDINNNQNKEKRIISGIGEVQQIF
jgi:hypothetical protein